MIHVEALSFAEARRTVVERVTAGRPAPTIERVRLETASARVLASPVFADRDYPPLPRSMRDGFAVRTADLPGTLEIIGEVRAGARFSGRVEPGQTVEIMTGAPVPEGADAVVMVEHVQTDGARVVIDRKAAAGANISAQGCDSRAGDLLLPAGSRLGYREAALLASAGAWEIDACRRPRVAIVSTGDELIGLGAQPLPHQIRNSNSVSLAWQVALAGGIPILLPPAKDELEATAWLIEEGLRCDLLLISGGVSAGKYDVVERALAEFDAEFYFDAVKIQPGKPCVFGRAREVFFFGLPGNPASAMVCFEVFARAALELLGGAAEPELPFTSAPLAEPLRHSPGLTRFLPAKLESDGSLRPVRWSGSGDLPAMARANCYLVTDPERGEYAQGEMIRVLLR
jgi:molybdopterin molybdotransferase